MKKSILLIIFLLYINPAFAYERIVSLTPSITEALFALGLGDKVVGVTSFCQYPEEAKKKNIIGSIISPNLEAIISLNPDLVVVSMEGNPKDIGDGLKQLNINTLIYQKEESFTDIFQNIFNLGKATNKEEEAKILINNLKSVIENVKKQASSGSFPTVFFQVGSEPLISVSTGTFIDNLIELAGGKNIIKGVATRYPQISIEEIIEKNPDVIIITTMGFTGQREKEKWEQFKTLSAVKNSRIYLIESELVCQTGPRIVIGLEKIAHFLHLEAFPK